MSGNMFLCWQGGGIQQTESFVLLRRGEAVFTRDLSLVQLSLQAVIERQNMREEEEDRAVQEEEVFLLQLAQMLVILVSLLAV